MWKTQEKCFEYSSVHTQKKRKLGVAQGFLLFLIRSFVEFYFKQFSKCQDIKFVKILQEIILVNFCSLTQTYLFVNIAIWFAKLNCCKIFNTYALMEPF